MDGDDAMLRTLTDEHGPDLFRYVLRQTRDRELAEDIVQETLARAWRHPGRIAAGRDPARAWLFTVARNLIIDDARSAHRRRELGVDEMPERATPDDTDAVLDRLMVVRRARLPVPRPPRGDRRGALPRPLGPRDRGAGGHRGGHREVAPPLRDAGAAARAAGAGGDAMTRGDPRLGRRLRARCPLPRRPAHLRGAPRGVLRVRPRRPRARGPRRHPRPARPGGGGRAARPARRRGAAGRGARAGPRRRGRPPGASPSPAGAAARRRRARRGPPRRLRRGLVDRPRRAAGREPGRRRVPDAPPGRRLPPLRGPAGDAGRLGHAARLVVRLHGGRRPGTTARSTRRPATPSS